MRANEKPLTVVTVDGATGRRLHDGSNFIQSPYLVRRPSTRSLSTDGRRQGSLSRQPLALLPRQIFSSSSDGHSRPQTAPEGQAKGFRHRPPSLRLGRCA